MYVCIYIYIYIHTYLYLRGYRGLESATPLGGTSTGELRTSSDVVGHEGRADASGAL